MNKREKVIKGLKCCLANQGMGTCLECNYKKEYGGACEVHLLQDIMELLKAQEAKDPVYTAFYDIGGKNLSHWNCGSCNAFLYGDAWFGGTLKDDRPKFCSCCGRAVKWK